MSYKTCCRCLITKATEEFYKVRNNKDGLMSFCKLCDNERKTKYLRNKKSPVKTYTLVARELAKEGLKRCPDCKEVKTFESFYKSGKSNNGYASHCIVCVSQKKEN